MRMLLAIRTRSKGKVSSRCSTECLFAFRSVPHYALNKYERATNSRFPFANNAGRTRGMPDAHALAAR
jgi:hypothetical protein